VNHHLDLVIRTSISLAQDRGRIETAAPCFFAATPGTPADSRRRRRPRGRERRWWRRGAAV